MNIRRYWPLLRIGDPAACAYCGATPTCVDHAIPMAYIALDRLNEHSTGIQVHACAWCNQYLAGRYFPTFQRRALWISNHWADKAARCGGHFTDEDLQRLQLDYGLEQYIKTKRNKRLAFQYMANWFNSSEFIDCLEGILWEPMLDPMHPKFHETYYDFFKPTIDEIKSSLASRQRFRTAWNWSAENAI